jgi:hypothetical protein
LNMDERRGRNYNFIFIFLQVLDDRTNVSWTMFIYLDPTVLSSRLVEFFVVEVRWLFHVLPPRPHSIRLTLASFILCSMCKLKFLKQE